MNASLHNAHTLDFDVVPQLAAATTTAPRRPAGALARAVEARWRKRPAIEPDDRALDLVKGAFPDKMFDSLKFRMRELGDLRKQHAAVQAENAALRRENEDLRRELAELAKPTDLDLAPILIALTEGLKSDPTLSYFKLYRLYQDGKVVGMQEGKGKSISICLNSLTRYLRANQPKAGRP